MSRCLGTAFLFLGLSFVVDAGAGSVEAGREKSVACLACHGSDGNSPADVWPKIAGQVYEYIVKQLQDFKAGRRLNDQMGPIVQTLSEQDIRDLAAYFSTQEMSAPEEGLDPVARGEQIYVRGTGRGPGHVTACIGCHGMAGEGRRDWQRFYARAPAVMPPALGGQHQAYVVRQLKAFQDGSRSNDVGRVMRIIAGRLSQDDIEAVAAYVAGIKR